MVAFATSRASKWSVFLKGCGSELISPRRPDAYHSCYVLAGLSCAQHHYQYLDGEINRVAALSDAFRWVTPTPVSATEISSGAATFDEADRVSPIHPIFVLPLGSAEKARVHFEAHPSF